MYHSLFTLERYVNDRIEQIASDRDQAAGADVAPRSSAPAVVAVLRHRVGSVLITLGERVGGPAVRAPRPPAPLPTHTPLLGF